MVRGKTDHGKNGSRHRIYFLLLVLKGFIFRLSSYTDMSLIQICLLFRMVFTHVNISREKLVKIPFKVEGILFFQTNIERTLLKRFILLIFKIVPE